MPGGQCFAHKAGSLQEGPGLKEFISATAAPEATRSETEEEDVSVPYLAREDTFGHNRKGITIFRVSKCRESFVCRYTSVF